MHNSFKSWTVKTSTQTVVCGTVASALKTVILAAKAGCRDIKVAIQTSPMPDSGKRIWRRGLERFFASCFTGKSNLALAGWNAVEVEAKHLLQMDWTGAFMGRSCLGIQFGISPPTSQKFSDKQQQLLRDFVLGRGLTGFCGQVETLLDLDLEGYTIWGGDGDLIRIGIESALTGSQTDEIVFLMIEQKVAPNVIFEAEPASDVKIAEPLANALVVVDVPAPGATPTPAVEPAPTVESPKAETPKDPRHQALSLALGLANQNLDSDSISAVTTGIRLGIESLLAANVRWLSKEAQIGFFARSTAAVEALGFLAQAFAPNSVEARAKILSACRGWEGKALAAISSVNPEEKSKAIGILSAAIAGLVISLRGVDLALGNSGKKPSASDIEMAAEVLVRGLDKIETYLKG